MKKDDLVKKLEQQLMLVAAERRSASCDAPLLAARIGLKRYQSARLADTHADLLAAPDSCGAAKFFLDELYGANDLCQRDVDLERIIPTLGRMLPVQPLHAITEAIVLDALSERLDTALACALGPHFDQASYLAAYRTTATRQEREHQLDLVQDLGEALCELVRIPLLSMTLSLMRGPAQVAKLADLHRFLERGFGTFRNLREPRAFVHTIVERERRVLANIHAGRANPFDLS